MSICLVAFYDVYIAGPGYKYEDVWNEISIENAPKVAINKFFYKII